MKPAPTNRDKNRVNQPQIVSREEWQRARDQLLVKEKAATRANDALSAERRRLPMVRIEKDYVFDGPDGKVGLLDLFEGRRQLIIYHFMFADSVDGWPSAGCPGCSMIVDYLGPCRTCMPATLPSPWFRVPRWQTSNLISGAWGWTVPWYSSERTDFNDDFGLSTAEGETFGLSVFLREGDDIFHTYFPTDRGLEVIDNDFTLLDWTPLGRQEE